MTGRESASLWECAARVGDVIERVLSRWDNEDRELVVRWQLWKSRWFPYRTAEWRGYDESTLEMDLGPWVWNRPQAFKRSVTCRWWWSRRCDCGAQR